MQFKLAKSYLYWWPVTVRLPDPDRPGKFLEQTLRLQLEPLPRDEVLADQEAMSTLATAREVIDAEIAQTLKVVRGWEGVVDDEGASVAFSPEALRLALQHSWFRLAVTKAVSASLNGEEARLGN